MLAHCTQSALGVRTLNNGDALTRVDSILNDLVDTHAQAAAAVDRHSGDGHARIRDAYEHTTAIAMWIGQCCAIASDVPAGINPATGKNHSILDSEGLAVAQRRRRARRSLGSKSATLSAAGSSPRTKRRRETSLCSPGTAPLRRVRPRLAHSATPSRLGARATAKGRALQNGRDSAFVQQRVARLELRPIAGSSAADCREAQRGRELVRVNAKASEGASCPHTAAR